MRAVVTRVTEASVTIDGAEHVPLEDILDGCCDALLGRDPANPEESQQVPQLEGQLYYRVLTLACLPVLLGLLGWGGWMTIQKTVVFFK